MLDLNDFRYFVRIVERYGITAVSRNLKVPKSAVSHGPQQLETSLGVRFLNKSSRSLSRER
jgi:DNA-binding transcriptional LysR family regulator